MLARNCLVQTYADAALPSCSSETCPPIWKGNYVDLIIHRYAKGWDYAEAQKNVDFFTDRTMIDSYKVPLAELLNRVNTVTGVRYGDDPSILAWETGNELAWHRKGKEPAPAA